MIDYYQILGVSSDAGEEEIRRAYQHLVRKWDPKHNDHPSASLRVVDYNDAWYWLGDPERRAKYDRDLTNFIAALTNASRQAREEERIERERQKRQLAAQTLRQSQETERREREARERLVRDKHERREREKLRVERTLQSSAQERIDLGSRSRNRQPTGEDRSASEVSKSTHNFVCLLIVIIAAIGIVLFVRLVWVSEQDPISHPSWDARERNERVSELRTKERQYQTEIRRLQTKISNLPSEREMLSRIAAIDSAITPITTNDRTDARLDMAADQIANSILAKVDATSVGSTLRRGTQISRDATTVAKDLTLYSASVDHFERESTARRDFWIFVAMVVGAIILLFVFAIVQGKRARQNKRDAERS